MVDRETRVIPAIRPLSLPRRPRLAAISTPEARQIVIKPFDASVLTEIVKAIQKSDLGITPQTDGKIVRLTMPPLSGSQPSAAQFSGFSGPLLPSSPCLPRVPAVVCARPL